jgi:hypothetical protein
MGESSGCGPNENELSLAPAKPMVVENPMMREAASKSMGVIGCLDNLRCSTTTGLTSKRTTDDQRRDADDIGALGFSFTASEGMCGVTGGFSDELVQAAEDLGSTMEEVSLSSVVDVDKDVLMVSESSRGSFRESVGGLRLSLEVIKPASGPGCSDEVKVGPILGPTILQVSEPKEAKPNRLQAICSRDGAGSSFEGPIVALVSDQNREGILPETAHGMIEEPVSG